jgi:hypothetical protein
VSDAALGLVLAAGFEGGGRCADDEGAGEAEDSARAAAVAVTVVVSGVEGRAMAGGAAVTTGTGLAGASAAVTDAPGEEDCPGDAPPALAPPLPKATIPTNAMASAPSPPATKSVARPRRFPPSACVDDEAVRWDDERESPVVAPRTGSLGAAVRGASGVADEEGAAGTGTVGGAVVAAGTGTVGGDAVASTDAAGDGIDGADDLSTGAAGSSGAEPARPAFTRSAFICTTRATRCA